MSVVICGQYSPTPSTTSIYVYSMYSSVPLRPVYVELPRRLRPVQTLLNKWHQGDVTGIFVPWSLYT